MNNKEKKQWIIRYAKNNKIDDILAEKYKKEKDSFLKKHTDEIQSICSIISVLVIGIASLFISVQYNNLADKQTQIMKYEQKPIIDIRIEDINDYTDKLLIVNNGTDAIDYKVEIFSFFEVLCNENKIGSVPIRVYFLNAIENIKNRNTDKVSEMVLYKESYPPIFSLKEDLHSIISEYTNLYWDFSFTYLIKVTSVDIMDEKNVAYFIYNHNSATRVSDEYGNSIEYEYNYMVDGDYPNTKVSKESFFDLESSNAKQIFKYALSKIRENNLYHVDSSTSEKYVLYGEYEPTE